jgi:hypothetical protein
MTQFTFKEISTFGTLLATSLIGVMYFRSVWEMWLVGALHPVSNIGLATGLTILLVVVLVIYHILIAVTTGQQNDDERDRLISWRAGSIGGVILGIGVISVVLQILVGGMFDDPVATSPLLIANALMAVVFVATIMELLLTLYYYRRGV